LKPTRSPTAIACSARSSRCATPRQRPPAAFQAGGEAAAPGRLPTREVGRHVKAAAGETRGIEAEAVVDLEPDPDVFCGATPISAKRRPPCSILELGEAAEGDGVEPHAARADAVQTPERVGAAGLERERARDASRASRCRPVATSD